MDKIIAKIEDRFEKQMESFEDSPIRTSIKWLIVIWIIKTVWKWVKES